MTGVKIDRDSVDLSRSRIEHLVTLGVADYLHVALLDAKEAAEVEAARLQDLVRAAFNEGFSSGVADFQTSRGGVTWYESKSRAALQKDTDK